MQRSGEFLWLVNLMIQSKRALKSRQHELATGNLPLINLTAIRYETNRVLDMTELVVVLDISIGNIDNIAC